MTQTTDTVKGSKEEICLCASCRNMLYEGDDLVDNVVMKMIVFQQCLICMIIIILKKQLIILILVTV